MLQHRTPTQKYTTPGGCYTTLMLAIAALLIYFLQLVGKISTLAAAAAGALIIVKALVEWQVAMRRLTRQHKIADATRKPEKLVRVLPQPIAGCYLCQKQRPLLAYDIEELRVGVCSDCHRCLDHTSHRI